jgi:hypothetical protein
MFLQFVCSFFKYCFESPVDTEKYPVCSCLLLSLLVTEGGDVSVLYYL